ncbi:HAD family hydrolase [Salinarchaeum sp. IM2453]|uniref:HAD family hydrolase n=1 Tax=Salinarchaeum sp. IM2453 TaxID=2862870 RepID=UPI001C83F6EA|nr:HAD family hydrolase [Salinarchaeum sp. IM2453]QZA88152.1 HAD family hydrolase [Salinarchaeum sp. IM2453]
MNTNYAAIIYDLDGTLVQLDVDWAQTRQDAINELADHGLTISTNSLWDVYTRAAEAELKQIVEQVITDHEKQGARSAHLLPLAGELPASVPVGVCSLNSEIACRIALEQTDLSTYIDTVVGRDTVLEQKPSPQPLNKVLENLEAAPEQAIFIGDSPRDQEAAKRANIDFEFVSDRISSQDRLS